MRRELFLTLLTLIFLLASCSESEIIVGDALVNDSEDEAESVVGEPADEVIEEPVAEEEKITEEVEVEPEVEVEEKSYTDDIVLKRRAGSYHFDRTEAEKEFGGYKFKGYNGVYSYDGATASVSVLYTEKADDLNLFNAVSNADDDSSVVALDPEKFDYLEKSIYYNPYDNEYFWLSKDKLIVVKHSIGTDLVEKYLKEYPVSDIEGSFDDKVNIVLEGEDNALVVFFKGTEYVFEITDVDSNRLTLMVNDEKLIINEKESIIASGLMMNVHELSYGNELIEFTIEREQASSLVLQLDSSKILTFDFEGERHSLEITRYDKNENEVTLMMDRELETFKENSVKVMAGLSLKLDKLFINNIGTEQVLVTIEVWK